MTESKTCKDNALSFKAVLPGLLCLVLAGCNTLEVNDTGLRPSANPVIVDTVMRTDSMANLARRQHPKILQTYGGEYSDPKVERMLARIVGKLSQAPDTPSQTYRITILDTPAINAFALPGGYLYITRGILALANDSAEIAAVLAHEMAHVTANHGLERQKREAEATLASRVVDEVVSGDSAARAAVVRGRLQLAQFSRNQELEADAIGIRTIGSVDYDPYAASRFLRSMDAYQSFHRVSGDSDPTLDFLASHPNAPRRIELAQRHARQFGPPGFGTRDRDVFLEGVDGLIYGDKPSQGYVRGRDFLHPTLGIAFTVPPEFVIDNSAGEVVAEGPDQLAFRFDGATVPHSVPLTTYLRSGWIGGIDSGSIRATTINGRDAAKARAYTEDWEFDVTVIRVADRVYRLLTGAPRESTRLDEIARSISNSFRVLDRQEAASLRPLRIRVVTVRPGETVATFANQMIGVERKLELFRLINSLGPGSTLSAGDKVKIITDR
ncbi:M48 family metalloprotease [Chelativorans sp. Marseille-P2723]|uniref:M48 family metalloprotease n=1 Tax=Chelativorans sp. Marseille-P2723 TaxID=2709133 RepID=UPI00156F0BCE|nr:M48 family metalloprotease [Chelativorans sp. Marseille-P2723]